jgi:REP element-mobilizing transposase RayT
MNSMSDKDASGDADPSRARKEVDAHPSRARKEAANVTQSSRPRPLPHCRGSERGNGSEHAMHSDALAYLITFTTYGTWLHGDERFSVDRRHNISGTPYVDPDPRRLRYVTTMLKHPPVMLGPDRRAVVQEAIAVVCERRDWTLHALNVRSNHVHVVVSAPQPPERVMNDFKSWATRGLVTAGLVRRGTAVWTRHGSTRYLWKSCDLVGACEYVSEHQGEDLD